MGKFPESAVEDKLAVSECVFEIGKKRPTKEPTEWFDRQEELLAARYPSLLVRREATGGNGTTTAIIGSYVHADCFGSHRYTCQDSRYT